MSELANNENMNMTTSAEGTHSGPYFEPRVDIYETEKALILLADLPGIGEDDIDIDLNDGELTILGKQKKDAASGKLLLEEFEHGNFIRKFTLTERIDQSKIQAEMKNGVLKLTLPLVEQMAPSKIVINNG